MKPFEGVIPALITPFADRGQVNFSALRRLVRFHVNAGVGGLYVTGSTGEWFRLDIAERKAIADAVIEEVNGRVPVAVHVGHFATSWVRDLARHAVAAGADYIASLPPGVRPAPPASVCEMVRYYAALCELGTPVLAYYLDGSGGPTDARAFIERIGALPGIAGVKYTSTDLFSIQNVSRYSGGRLRVWTGHDQMALAGLAMDACGIIGANYNYLPELYVALYSAFRDGDLAEARRIQSLANEVLAAVKQFGNLTAYKAVLELRGLSGVGVREPVLPLDPDGKRALAATLDPWTQWLQPIS